MKITVDVTTLGRKQLWNHCTERHDILGLVCKEAGIKDSEMDHRMCVILKKDDDDDVNTRSLPSELSPFFTETKSWSPISKTYKGSVRFGLNELGLKIADMNDSYVSGGIGDDDALAEWESQVVAALFEGGIGVDWAKL